MKPKRCADEMTKTSVPVPRALYRLWNKNSRRLKRHKKYLLRLILVLLFAKWMLKKKPHPTTTKAPPGLLFLPSPGQDVLDYAHNHAREHELPVYLFYKARSGQLNNQLISFFNALTIAKEADAVLVAPFAFYGSESYVDFAQSKGFLYKLYEACDLYIYQPFLKAIGLFYKHDELVGDYIDGSLLNKTQPVVSIMHFLKSPGADYLRTFPHVLARKGDAPFYYMSLGKRTLFQENVNMRGEPAQNDLTSAFYKPASRRDLDCNFNVSDHFRGLQYSAGVNGNFLFLSRLYRSHSLNCTESNPYWLELRRYVQPRVEIRELVEQHLVQWEKVLAIHVRLFPSDFGKFAVRRYCQYMLKRFDKQIRDSDTLYIAYSSSSEDSAAIVSELRRTLADKRIATAADFGSLRQRGPVFNKRYTIPFLDMWVCVWSNFFVGRLGSSLSWNVAYWRAAFSPGVSETKHEFYQLKDFSDNGESNPTDSYGF
ncbi:hypothetical protein BWQ96_05656 [Gracilariopsis chorda]|uniref:Uncharacterized protein n=1 Tax=Gracilariopsis chorda TaxID=448386 RepID=A0A2V3IR55_9FLOR|nr:hypothetical protein BWQ96_05656 [Gracilariopsis chorda]|eukprot:PXF44579.1 hypothetical protein BWQ96_05656 [Gracilariopsis chorda]